MSDIRYTATMDGKEVLIETSKMSKAGQQLARTMGRRGGKGSLSLAFLEGTRAIEDFTVAGMRGAINNIPGLIMHLGAGAGLAGAISLFTVAAWKGVQAIEALMDKAREAKEAKLAQGFSFINTDKIVEDAKASAKEASKAFQETMSMHERGAKIYSAYAGAEQRKEVSRLAVKQANELAVMRSRGATDEAIATKELEHQFQMILLQNKARKEGLSQQEANIRALEGEASRQQSRVDASLKAQERLKEITKEEIALRAELSKKMTKGGQLELHETAAITSQIEEQVKNARNLKREEIATLKADIERGARASKNLELLEKQLETKKEELKLAEINSRAQKAELADRTKLLNIKKAEQDIERKMAKEEAERDLARSMAVTADGLLSSAGRSGLGATEALSALNIQKSMLSVLKKIERNTQGDKISLAG